MSNRYFCKKPHEKRAEAKGPVKIGGRGSFNRRVLNDFHVTKGRISPREHDIGATTAGQLYLSFLG